MLLGSYALCMNRESALTSLWLGPMVVEKAAFCRSSVRFRKKLDIASCASVFPPSTHLRYLKRMSSGSLSVKFLDKYSIRAISIKRLSHLSKESTVTRIFVQLFPHFCLRCLPCCSLLCLYLFPMVTQTS